MTIAPYAQPGVVEVVCITVLVVVWVAVLVTVDCGAVAVAVLVTVDWGRVTVWVTVVVVGGWLEAVVVETLVEVVLVVVDVVEVDVVETGGVVLVDVVVVEVVPEAEYSNVVVPVAPVESVAVMTNVPVTHSGVPPTCVLYEKVPEDVTAAVVESSTVKEPWSCTLIETLSETEAVGLIVPEMV
jgi:hypothetical protein